MTTPASQSVITCFFKYMMVSAVLLLISSSSVAQGDSTAHRHRVRNIIWFTPNTAARINGIAVGFQAMNLYDDKLEIHGLNLDIGLAAWMGVPYAITDVLSSKKKKIAHFMEVDSSSADMHGASFSMGGEIFSKIRGINIAGGITGANSIHGISVTGVYSKTVSFRGVCVAGLMNIATNGTGLQIGIFNNCKNLKGLQLGLWNKSGKRGLPFINWGT